MTRRPCAAPAELYGDLPNRLTSCTAIENRRTGVSARECVKPLLKHPGPRVLKPGRVALRVGAQAFKSFVSGDFSGMTNVPGFEAAGGHFHVKLKTKAAVEHERLIAASAA